MTINSFDATLVSVLMLLFGIILGLLIRPARRDDVHEIVEQVGLIRKEMSALAGVMVAQLGFIESLQNRNGDLSHQVSVIQADRGGILAKYMIMSEQVQRLTDSLEALSKKKEA